MKKSEKKKSHGLILEEKYGSGGDTNMRETIFDVLIP